MGPDVVAVVPLKALEGVKRRLSPVLDAPARRALVAWMLERVLDVCRVAPSVGRVVVVAGDDAAAGLAHGLGAEVLLHPSPGLRAALRRADAHLSPAAATLVLAADLPLAESADIERVCEAVPRGERGVVVVPTTDGGTAALLRRPGAVVPPLHGPASAARHLRAAVLAGVPGVELCLPQLGFDVDLPEHLAALSAWRRTRAPRGES